MYRYEAHQSHRCRWCGTPYYSKKPLVYCGFCSSPCKQAHYRAYKNYVTGKRISERAAAKGKVTHKARKK